jgi:hypothetical protein
MRALSGSVMALLAICLLVASSRGVSAEGESSPKVINAHDES